MQEIQYFSDTLRKQLRSSVLRMTDGDILDALMVSENQFINHEGELWDFKEEWPFSYSDDYYLGLLKLTVSFANNIGGLTVFNVLDADKTYRRSKIVPKPDRLISSFRDRTNNFYKVEYRELLGRNLMVPILITYPNPIDHLPASVDNWKQRGKKYWFVRDGYECVNATTKKIPILFCRHQLKGSDINSDLLEVSLPPSPVTIKNFLTRFEIIERVFEWMHDLRQPRCFLYGRGGSGKTTIAYEIARHIAEYNCSIKCDEYFDIVIFISAKKRELNTYSNKQDDFSGTDFSNSRELYIALLVLSSWYTRNDVEEKSDDELISLLEEMFDTFSFFIVLDDIDTITTRGEDAGLETILLLLARARKSSKVLYTLRNAPTHAMKNAIQVAGLTDEEEIQQFVKLCSDQFRVLLPKPAEIEEIVSYTEGRPLGIESILALRRFTDSYSHAIASFERHAGDDARSYVFEREWEALSANHRGRHLLATLSLVAQPMSRSELQTVLRFDDDSLAEAIAETLEMFIDVEDGSTVAKYSLGNLTRQFVNSRSSALPRFEELKARVKTFKSTFHPKLPELNQLRAKTDRLLFLAERHDDVQKFNDAWSTIRDQSLPQKLVQNPYYMELVAHVALRLPQPKLSEAREFLSDAHKQGFRISTEILSMWHFKESMSGLGDQHCPDIQKIVLQNKTYTESDRIELTLREASRLYNRAKDIRFDNHDRAINMLLDSCIMHFENLHRSEQTGHIKIDRIFEYARNTTFLFFSEIGKVNTMPYFSQFLGRLKNSENLYIDPLVQPIAEYGKGYSTSVTSKKDAGSALSVIKRSLRLLENPDLWIYQESGKEVIGHLKDMANILSIKSK